VKKRHLLALFIVFLLAGCGPTAPAADDGEMQSGEPERLILATTTSTENSGLLDFILPVFEESHNADVDIVAVGTGQALQLGEDGNADVLMVHARALEDAFMEAGHGCGPSGDRRPDRCGKRL
jgi:tungstate transport system substrate-binding protein